METTPLEMQNKSPHNSPRAPNCAATFLDHPQKAVVVKPKYGLRRSPFPLRLDLKAFSFSIAEEGIHLEIARWGTRAAALRH